MNYRTLGKTGIKVSEVGFGAEHLEKMEYENIKPVIDAVIEADINIIDVFMPEPNVRSNIGRALAGRRDKVMIQGHFGAAWQDGQYLRTRELELTKTYFEDLMTRLRTDYIDFGMFHFVDSDEDLEAIITTDVLSYAQELKKSGTIRAVGMSSHNPAVALRAVKTGAIDILLFTVNPAFDLLPATTDMELLFSPKGYADDTLKGMDAARKELYETCETGGVAITVMKGLAAGTLLKAETSPFGVALTPVQCIHYALTRPGVASFLVGCRTPEEVRIAARYSEASEEEKDFSVILGNTSRYAMTGKCMYCNHCLPCPSEIDIARVMKYLDLASGSESVPDSLKSHYYELSSTAADCIGCGTCENNCPFTVPVRDRMRKAVEVFGK